MRNAEQWDERYRDKELVWSAEPNRWVAEIVGAFPPGRAVDLAAGEGRNAIWLARRGWTVTAIDFSAVGLDKGRQLAEHADAVAARRITWVVADLVAHPLPAQAFDLVLIAYLHLAGADRPGIVGKAADAVAPGGHLLIAGHDSANLQRGVGGPQDPSVLYTAADLTREIEGSGLTVVRGEECERAVDGEDRPALDVVFLARRDR